MNYTNNIESALDIEGRPLYIFFVYLLERFSSTKEQLFPFVDNVGQALGKCVDTFSVLHPEHSGETPHSINHERF